MSKTLRTIATVVEIAVAVAAAIPTGGGSTLLFGLSTATAGLVATGVTVAGTAISALTAKLPGVSISGNQTQFTSNPAQGVPYPIGRTAVAGWNVHDITWDTSDTKNNTYQTFFGVWGGGGPVHALETFDVDQAAVSFSGENAATSPYSGWMYLHTQLGACPEPAELVATSFAPHPPGWDNSSRMSGYAGYAWTLKFDKFGKAYPGGTVPQPRAILQGVLVYDPRQDSTYPGGSGACRPLQEETYVYSENPGLHGLTWALGRWQNGRRVLGIGMSLTAIDVPAFVQAANVADLNNWKIGGVVYSTDSKWQVLQKMLAACSGVPLQLGGILSCHVDTPRVSLATITDDDIIGDASVVATPTTSSRINGCIPSCRLEAQDWQIVPCAKVTVDDYVAADGKPRTKAITWELVQDTTQVAQLATYAIANAREFGPIVTPLKLRWIGYKPGDCLTIDSATLGMTLQKVVVEKRSLDPASGAVTFTSRSETDGKHPFALAATTTPPPTPSLQIVDRSQLLQPGLTYQSGAHRFNSMGVAYPLSSNDSSISVAAFSGVLDDARIISLPAGSVTGLAGGVQYGIFWSDDYHGYVAGSEPATEQWADDALIFIGWQATSSTGTYPTSPTPPAGYGGSGSNPNVRQQ